MDDLADQPDDEDQNEDSDVEEDGSDEGRPEMTFDSMKSDRNGVCSE
jgi:hypothetical protein